MFHVIFSVLASWLFLQNCLVHACTDFLIKANDGTFVNGRSMEFTAVQSMITACPREQKIASPAPNQHTGISWTSKYGYLAISCLGIDAVVDGLNEAGLSFNVLWMPNSKYQEVPAGQEDRALLIDRIGDWILGNFSTVDEVKEALPHVIIWGRFIKEINMVPLIHIAIHDHTGKSLVIEFIDGQQKVHDNPIQVLTNYPAFEWHVDNLRNYVHARAADAPPMSFNGLSLHVLGQGSGMLGIPGDWMSASRFVKMAIFKHFICPGNNAMEAVNAAEHLLNTVDIPLGDIRNEETGEFWRTQWITIKDLTNKVLYYRTFDNLSLRSIDLKALNLSPGETFRSVMMETVVKPVDITKDLKGG